VLELRRFALLARAHWAESWRKYAWFLAAGVLLHLAISIVCFAGEAGFTSFDVDGQRSLYFTGLFVLAPIFASRYFLPMSSRASALLALMRPASVFEKWLLAALTIAVLYPLAYTLAFYLVDAPDRWLACAQAKHYAMQQAQVLARSPLGEQRAAFLREQATFRPEEYRLMFPWMDVKSWRAPVGIVLLLCSLQGMAVFGSLFFRAVPLVKTVLCCLLLVLVCMVLTAVFKSRPDVVLSYWGHRRPLSPLQEILYPALWLAYPGLFWLASFLALKEREIAP